MHRTSTARMMQLFTGLLIIASIAGCASPSNTRPEFGKTNYCESGSALICTKRLGKVEKCKCSSRDTFEDILNRP